MSRPKRESMTSPIGLGSGSVANSALCSTSRESGSRDCSLMTALLR